jgi:hypothetical protein
LNQVAAAALKPRVPWWAAVFVLAAAVRLLALYGIDRPIGQRHIYLTSALWIAEHSDPVGFVLRSDEWQIWPGRWTLAPLYTLVLGGLFRLLGPDVGLVQLLQCLMDASTAVLVGALGREASPRRGAWAGALYALYWPAAFLSTRPLTENLHTFLLVGAFLLLLRGAARSRDGDSALGGFLLGVSALARAVSSAFLPLVAVWTLLSGPPPRMRRAVLVLALGFAAILPWTARNILCQHDRVLIESVSAFNLWNDNAFIDAETYQAQKRAIAAQPTPAQRRAQATAFALSAIRSHPGALVEKAWDNLRHVLRPDGLHQLLVAEDPDPWWRHAAVVVLGDGLLLLCIPPFLLYLARRPPPAGSLVALWTVYYLALIVVVFHSEIRYRSPLVPFVFVGAVASIGGPDGPPRGLRDRTALALGLALVFLAVRPYGVPAWRAARAAVMIREARPAVAAGDAAGARALVSRASAADPASARPWLTYGRWLASRGMPAEALGAYDEADRRRPEGTIPALVRPRLLREAGLARKAERALEQAHAAAERLGPGEALEIAWRELPAPRADEVLLGRDDYGAALGFPVRGLDHRISGPRAWLRLRPTLAAPAYELSLVMASPAGSPLEHPVVGVRVNGDSPRSFTLEREARTFSFTVPSAPEVLVEIHARAWSRSDQPPQQGVLVERLEIRPSS